MNNIQDNPLLMALAGAVLNPGLRTVLVYDAPYAGLQQIARYLKAILHTLDHKVIITQLGSREHDDDLWGYMPLPSGESTSHQEIQLKPLPFSRKQSMDQIELVLLPNLAEVSLAVARAGIMLMGSSVVHLERNGQSETWKPQQYWIASCSSNDIGAVSSHLVDRFAIRLRWQDASFSLNHRAHVQHLRQRIENPTNYPQLSAADYTQIQAVTDLIEVAQQHQPSIDPDLMITSLVEYFPEQSPTTQISHRHEITLARYAVSLAQLRGDDHVSEQHISDAATLLGIKKHTFEADTPDPLDEKTAEQEGNTPLIKPGVEEKDKQATTDQRTAEAPITQEKKEQVTAEERESSILPLLQSILAPDNPYLEDSAPILHEDAALRLPWRRSPLSRSDHGSIVGIEKGPSLRDVAIVSTILHAALFRKLRQSTSEQAEKSTSIHINREDLHHYRRSPAPEHMLLLVLDYTSLKRCNWPETLLPYLSWAYINRASISIVKVGAQDTQSELQAEIVHLRNMLASNIDTTLEQPAGKATPLAHGMQLALQTLQRNLQHGRNTVQHVTLVVLSDGRGNIPLQASITNRLVTPVTTEGIEDALQIAQEIRTMKHVSSILLNPQPGHYIHLPVSLANALGAAIVPIAPLMEEHEVIE